VAFSFARECGKVGAVVEIAERQVHHRDTEGTEFSFIGTTVVAQRIARATLGRLLRRPSLRRVLLLLLLLPLPALSQIKILMPVVVKDASGKAVTDLKPSDFRVSGPKKVNVEKMWLIEPGSTAGKPAVFLLYDPINTPWFQGGPHITLGGILHEIAIKKLPVNVYANIGGRLRPVYDVGTPPEVLAEALDELGRPPSEVSDAELIGQLSKYTSSIPVGRPSIGDAQVDRIRMVANFAELAQQWPGGKALILPTSIAPVKISPNTNLWSQENLPAVPRLPLYEGMVEELNAANVSVYPVYIGIANPTTHGFASDEFVELQQMAESTGGSAFRHMSIVEAVDATLSDFGAHYMLAVSVPSPKDLDWIPVKIKVNRPDVKVQAAPGFYGLKPEKTPSHP
jgi:hypothetical protein